MSDIYLDPTTGDIDLVGNTPILITDSATLIRQRLQIRLNTFLDEWFYNASVGLPYYTEILTQRYDKFLVESVIRREILDTQGVLELTSFSSTFNAKERKLDFNFNVTTSKGVISVQI